MSVNSCFRTPVTGKRVHVSQTLPEPAVKHFNSSFPLMWEKLSWKISTFVRLEMLRLFGNTLMPDHKYSRHRLEKLPEQFQTLLSQKRRTFFSIFIALSESIQNFSHF